MLYFCVTYPFRQSNQHFFLMASLNILILEDDPNDADMMLETLKRAGHEISPDICDSFQRYEKALTSRGFDLIIADYRLPDINGLEALQMAEEICPQTPFIFVTGTIGEELAAETVLQGANGFVLKHNLERLPSVVESALDDKTQTNNPWWESRLRKASERLIRQIESNQEVLSRAKKFLNQEPPEEEAPEHDLRNLIEDQIETSQKRVSNARRLLRRKIEGYEEE